MILAIWTGVLVMVGLIWVTRHGQINRAARDEALLHPGSAAGNWGAQAPVVSVIVAAKDEQDNIGLAIRTMMVQDYPDFEMIVINDRSMDSTGRIVDELAAEHERLRVVHVEWLREGWFGKNNAMREGVERARGQWLCFSDADCSYTSPKLLSVALRYAVDNGVDFLSVLPILETCSVWERIIQPVCGAVMVFWFRPERVNNPRSKAAYANGAFMLIRRDAYDRIGGHEPVKAEVNEDVHMARLTKAAGLKLAVVQNRGLYQTRMYSSFGQIWRGWGRIFYGCFGSLGRLALTLGFLVMISLLPWLSALAAWGFVGLGRVGGWLNVALAGTAAALVQWTVMVRFYRLAQADPRYAITYPLGALICCGAVLQAMLKLLGGSTTWRGTTYRGSQVVQKRR